eukprot:8655648-Alexandrium_andersonii.AAC.1
MVRGYAARSWERRERCELQPMLLLWHIQRRLHGWQRTSTNAFGIVCERLGAVAPSPPLLPKGRGAIAPTDH